MEDSKVFTIAEIVGYATHSAMMQGIMDKVTGSVTASSYDAGESSLEKISPFETFIQIIDGKAEVLINDKPTTLEIGQAIIIPGHARSRIRANERFKMLSVIIKSGYEEVS